MSGAGARISVPGLGPLTRLAAGGQGIVYSAPMLRMQYASSMVYKEYKQAALAGLDVSALESMPTYLETLTLTVGMELLSRAAWPCRLVEDSGVVKGFVMPAIPPEFFFDMRKASGMARQAGEFQHLLNGESFLARRHIPLTDRHRYELLVEIAEALSLFHNHGIVVGDLSPKNLLYSIDPTSKVFFIDCDAMRFKGRSVVPQLETPGWEVRAVNSTEELGTNASDAYKFALLALRLLISDQASRDPSRLPASVPSPVRALIKDGLSRSPDSRPIPSDWIPDLTAAASRASTKVPLASTPTPRPLVPTVAPHVTVNTGNPASTPMINIPMAARVVAPHGLAAVSRPVPAVTQRRRAAHNLLVGAGISFCGLLCGLSYWGQVNVPEFSLGALGRLVRGDFLQRLASPSDQRLWGIKVPLTLLALILSMAVLAKLPQDRLGRVFSRLAGLLSLVAILLSTYFFLEGSVPDGGRGAYGAEIFALFLSFPGFWLVRKVFHYGQT